MSTKHSIAATTFLQNKPLEEWQDETLWQVREKRDRMIKQLPEWEELR